MSCCIDEICDEPGHQRCAYRDALELKVEILYTALNDLVAETLGSRSDLIPSITLGKAKKALRVCRGSDDQTSNS